MKNCIAIAEDGTWFSTEENLTHFKSVNPTIFTTKVGDTVTIRKTSLLSAGTTGKIIGFDRSSSGKLLLLIKWHKDAAPLRVGIAAIMVQPPRKFWMVIPLNTRSNHQGTGYQGDTRRNGTSPAVNRFTSIREAENYINDERRRSGWDDYVLLQPVAFYTRNMTVSF